MVREGEIGEDIVFQLSAWTGVLTGNTQIGFLYLQICLLHAAYRTYRLAIRYLFADDISLSFSPDIASTTGIILLLAGSSQIRACIIQELLNRMTSRSKKNQKSFRLAGSQLIFHSPA